MLGPESYFFDAMEKQLPTYEELKRIPTKECGEPFVSLDSIGIHCRQDLSSLPPSSGEALLLRKSVGERLKKAQDILFSRLPGAKLAAVYAYRSLEIQRSKFEQIQRELGLVGLTDDAALSKVQVFVAVPDVAGHPTGAAIDLTIVDQAGTVIDMGTPIHSLVNESFTFCPFIEKAAWRNRNLLREVMTSAGFAPYDGEWWHFSYGDKDWPRSGNFSQIGAMQVNTSLLCLFCSGRLRWPFVSRIL